MKKSFFSLLVVPIFVSAQLNSLIEEWKNDKDLKNASIGFCVQDAQTSQVLAEYNSHQSLIPASTLKLLTTSAAIGLLGSNYRYDTRIYYNGTFNSKTGILNGDLIIFGNGDPTLQSEFFSSGGELITDKWAKILKEKGLKEITGKIIGDASYFERIIPDDWIWADISNYFGATPCGLSFMDNKFKIAFTSKDQGSVAVLKNIFPNYLHQKITLSSKVISKGTEDQAYVYGDPFSYSKTVSGTIPINKNNFEIEAALPDPALLCAESLYTSLKNYGIKCDTNLIESRYQTTDSLKSSQLLYTHVSTSLDKIILHTNLRSDNHYCESLLLTIGKGNMKMGLELVKKYWAERGLDMDEVYMVDASGLSRANTVTAGVQTSLLGKVFRDSLSYKIISPSLPIAGRSGSMSSIGKGTFIENNMRAKTGYINRARGYCGYVKTKSGKNLAFSVIFNNYNCRPTEAKKNIEKFLIELANL